jgi:hypothetical protein
MPMTDEQMRAAREAAAMGNTTGALRKALNATPTTTDAGAKVGGDAIIRTNMDKDPPKRRRKCCGKAGCRCRRCRQGIADQALTGGG